MSLEPGPPRSISPESSGRDTPNPSRQWRNQLGAGENTLPGRTYCSLRIPDWKANVCCSLAEEGAPVQDKAYRKYATGVERALGLFETALQEWADYISFLNRLLKVRFFSVRNIFSCVRR